MALEPEEDPLVAVPIRALAARSIALRSGLCIHGFIGMAIGTSLLLRIPTGPSFAALRQVPGWPWFWGLALLVCSILLLLGLRLGRFAVARVGILAQAFWYATQTIGFGLATFRGGSLYPTLIYIGLALLMFVHNHWLREHGRWNR